MNYKMPLMIFLLNLKKIGIKNPLLRKMISTLTKECENLQNKNEVLKRKNSILKETVEDLEKSLAKYVDEKEKLDAILGKQKCSLDKTGIEYNPFKKRKLSKNRFETPVEKTKITSFYCRKKDHLASQCFSMQKYYVVKKAWVPKGPLKTNPKGPKIIWIPKVKD